MPTFSIVSMVRFSFFTCPSQNFQQFKIIDNKTVVYTKYIIDTKRRGSVYVISQQVALLYLVFFQIEWPNSHPPAPKPKLDFIIRTHGYQRENRAPAQL